MAFYGDEHHWLPEVGGFAHRLETCGGHETAAVRHETQVGAVVDAVEENTALLEPARGVGVVPETDGGQRPAADVGGVAAVDDIGEREVFARRTELEEFGAE